VRPGIALRAAACSTPPLESHHARIATPFAVLGIRTVGELVTDITYLPRGAATLAPLNKLAAKACRQIERYLDDPCYRFTLPFDYRGSEFQCRVWREIAKISAGKTNTYKEVALRLHSAPRPVGGACGKNRLPLLIPCHRVLAANGIGGFMHARAGDPISIKRWLLAHEGVHV
jgi:methylated-DNA-[protein]-cysteine S-methyltransferase